MSDSPKRAEQSPLVDDPEGNTQETDDEVEEFRDDDEFIEENEEELERALTEDIYSLLYTSPICGPTFIFAFVIFLLQSGLLLLIFLDLLDTSSEPNETNDVSNRIDLPAGAEMEVTIAQFVGILLTVMVTAFHGDSVKGIMQLMEGYSPTLMQDSPNAYMWKWLLTGALQATEGFLLLVVSFILIMQSSSVIDLTLNLTGLHFIQELDDMGFSLAAAGLISKRTQDDCHHIAELNKSPTPKEKKDRLKVIKRVLILLIAIGLLIPYFIVVSWQFHGRYMCGTVFVQFGDNVLPDMTYYTGQFHIQGSGFGDRLSWRPYYLDETGSVRLAYCRAERAWGFSYTTNDHCDYFIKSDETQNFDLIEIADNVWFAKTKGGELPVDWLALTCNDCTEDRCQGTCVDNKCECEGERLGFNCEYQIPTCNYYSLDYRTKGSLANIPGARIFFETEFTSLTEFGFIAKSDPLYVMYDRLWYIPNPDTENPESKYVNSFIVFTGRRWVIFGPKSNEARPLFLLEFYQNVRSIYTNDERDSNQLDKVKTIFKSDAFSSYTPLFFSTPVDWGAETYGVEPSDVKWVLAREDNNLTLSYYRADDDSPIGARLMCTECNNEGTPCLNEGLCSDNGHCQCTPFFDGNLCEYARSCVNDKDCYNGGICDTTTNMCICADKYFGKLCQNPNTIDDLYYCSRTENSCFNGTCNGFEERCDCFDGFQGRRCEVEESRK